MDWVATEKLLKRISKDIWSGYEEYLFVKGLYPDVIKKYPEKVAEDDADYFSQVKETGLEYFGESEIFINNSDLNSDIFPADIGYRG